MAPSSSTPGSKPRFHSGSAEPRGFLPENGADLRHTSPTVTATYWSMLPSTSSAPGASGRLASTARPRDSTRWPWLISMTGTEKDCAVVPDTRLRCTAGTLEGTPVCQRHILDLSRTPMACWRSAFHEALRGMRKVALRLGEVAGGAGPLAGEARGHQGFLQGKRGWHDLGDDDFQLALRQKGVDMRLGLDVASLAYKRQVNQIVLIAGDADFVPAAKLARREGIDFVL